eukprot:5557451-Alexandrium_andersonii.AAC.1
MSASLVGSEMCIRDRPCPLDWCRRPCIHRRRWLRLWCRRQPRPALAAVSYTHLTLPTICSV